MSDSLQTMVILVFILILMIIKQAGIMNEEILNG